jgi:hypothetical protein
MSSKKHDDEYVEIENYPDYYINRSGDVISKKGIKERHLSTKPLDKGYKNVKMINKNGERRREFIHRILAKTFIENTDNQSIVRHLDDNKLNNTLDNLAWGNQQDNTDDAVRNGIIIRNSIYCYETDTIYTSAHEASQKIGIRESSIQQAARGLMCHAKGYHFCYEKDMDEKLSNINEWIVCKNKPHNR